MNFKDYLGTKIYNEDERNLLPKDFDDYIDDNFGSFENFLSDHDVNIDDYIPFFLDRSSSEDEAEELAIEQLKDEYEDKFYSYINLYQELGNALTLYRTISLPVKNLNDLENLKDEFSRMKFGVYWTYDYSATDSYWGNQSGTRNYTLKAQVKAEQVDWKETLNANMSFYIGEEEKEIRLYENTIINLISIKDDSTKKIQEINMKVKV